jgi:FkbM family methyltransferase
MINYLINSFKRKLARRITKKYPTEIDQFHIEGFGAVSMLNWKNPLVEPKTVTSETVNFFKQFLEEGDLAIDIGANIGHMTIPISLVTGKNGLTLAFDPNPFVFEILQDNATLNPDITYIQTFNYAVTTEEEEFFYISSEASFNNGGISKVKNDKHGKYYLDKKVKGVVLEEFISQHFPNFISKIKLVKIDTEGYDKEIIKSITGLLKTYKPVVITECFGKNNQAERNEHFHLLKSMGYSLFYFSDFDINAQVIPIEKQEDMMNWKHFDLYAIAN